MTEPELPRQAVLACFDGSEGSTSAVRWAANEARARGKPLIVVQSFEWAMPLVGPGATSTSAYGEDTVREFAADQLAEVEQEARGLAPRTAVHTTMPNGRPEDTVPKLAEELDPVLVVLGASGRGAVARVLLGSTAAELARTLRHPLVVVRGEPAPEGAPVVVGVDGAGTSERALEFAVDFAERHGVGVRAVHAWSDWPLDVFATAPPGQVGMDHVDNTTQELARKRVEALRGRHAGTPVDWEPVTEPAAGALLDRAEGASLVVVGSHGRGALGRALLGSVSHAVLYHAPCPVAVLRDTHDAHDAHEEDTS